MAVNPSDAGPVPLPPELVQARDRLADPDAIAALHTTARPKQAKDAAVLILFTPGADGLQLVLVEKRADLRHHAGQIAFPGGTIDPTDADPVAAALREAWEEAAIEPPSVSVLGVLPTAPLSRTGFEVTPVVGWWSVPGVPLADGNTEIAAVHQVGVRTLLDPSNRDTWRHPRGVTGPGFRIGELYIWGFTAHLLDALFEWLGWASPWDAGRVRPIPARFLNEPR